MRKEQNGVAYGQTSIVGSRVEACTTQRERERGKGGGRGRGGGVEGEGERGYRNR